MFFYCVHAGTSYFNIDDNLYLYDNLYLLLLLFITIEILQKSRLLCRGRYLVVNREIRRRDFFYRTSQIAAATLRYRSTIGNM